MAVYCCKTKWLEAVGSQDFCHFAATMSEAAQGATIVQQSATKYNKVLLSATEHLFGVLLLCITIYTLQPSPCLILSFLVETMLNT